MCFSFFLLRCQLPFLALEHGDSHLSLVLAGSFLWTFSGDSDLRNIPTLVWIPLWGTKSWSRHMAKRRVSVLRTQEPKTDSFLMALEGAPFWGEIRLVGKRGWVKFSPNFSVTLQQWYLFNRLFLNNGYVSASFVLKMGTQRGREKMRHFSVEVPRVLWGVKEGSLQYAQKNIGGNIKGHRWRKETYKGACKVKGKH